MVPLATLSLPVGSVVRPTPQMAGTRAACSRAGLMVRCVCDCTSRRHSRRRCRSLRPIRMSGVGYALLGELDARIVERPRESDRCVVLGWAGGRDGRKLFGGAAIYSEAGVLLASSAATWVELSTRTPAE